MTNPFASTLASQMVDSPAQLVVTFRPLTASTSTLAPIMDRWVENALTQMKIRAESMFKWVRAVVPRPPFGREIQIQVPQLLNWFLIARSASSTPATKSSLERIPSVTLRVSTTITLIPLLIRAIKRYKIIAIKRSTGLKAAVMMPASCGLQEWIRTQIRILTRHFSLTIWAQAERLPA